MKNISKLPIQHYAKEFNVSIDMKELSFILTENLNVYVLMGYTFNKDQYPQSKVLKERLVMEESLFLGNAVFIPWFRAKQFDFLGKQEQRFVDKYLIPKMRRLYCDIRCFEEDVSLLTPNKMRCFCLINSNQTSNQVIYGIGY